jgi:hypothetical protein
MCRHSPFSSLLLSSSSPSVLLPHLLLIEIHTDNISRIISDCSFFKSSFSNRFSLLFLESLPLLPHPIPSSSPPNKHLHATSPSPFTHTHLPTLSQVISVRRLLLDKHRGIVKTILSAHKDRCLEICQYLEGTYSTDMYIVRANVQYLFVIFVVSMSINDV